MTKLANGNVRCAIYTRKSTEEGLEQEFNSLDAQREAAHAYIASQRANGWLALPERYDDGGFTGGNMERPALKRLLLDIAVGQVDCVVVYKVDRLSRSLLDFAKMMETFDKQRVAFVSVTQQFNTATSMGRLVLNVLLSFAQFEREIISERTRDKIAATRRKGKWAGGHPLLGYDVDAQRFKLIVNPQEAIRVRAIFALYLKLRSLSSVAEELNRRNGLTKSWTTRKGRQRGGQPFTKTNLHKLLTNVVYLGKVRYKQETHDGEHEAIVDEVLWQQVQALLRQQGRARGNVDGHQAVLKGLLRCVACDRAMTPAHVTKNRAKRYRYYVCTSAQKRGWHSCPSKSLAAPAAERLVGEQLHSFVRDALQRDTSTTQAHCVSDKVQPESPRADATALCVPAARALLEHGWDGLAPAERIELVRLLLERVNYDGAHSKLALTVRTAEIGTLVKALKKETAHAAND
jgi:site-specific DNA recombinase